MKNTKLMLPFAIAMVLATAACNREADDAATTDDTTATDTTAETADTGAMGTTDGTATDSMATDPAAPPPPTDGTMTTDPAATSPTPTDPAAMGTPPAAGASAGAAMSVSANDKNADGGLSMEELPAGDALRDQFSTADADGNGMLSQAEIDKHMSSMQSNQPAQ
jgi:hypothetical protein